MALEAVKVNSDPFELVTFRRETAKYFLVDYGPPRFNELDSYAIMWNGHFVNYFENARQQLAKYTELNTTLLESYGFQVPIHSYQVKLRKPIEANDAMRVAVRPLHFKGGLLEFEHLMMVGAEIRAVGTTTHAVIEMKTRSIAFPMPELVHDVINRVFKPFHEATVAPIRPTTPTT